MFIIKKYTYTICVGCVWIVIYFLLKQAFNGLLKVIGIQTYL